MANETGRTLLLLGIAVLSVIAGWVVFLVVPTTLADLVGVLLVIVTGVVGMRFGRSVVERWYPTYDVAEVAVEGPITRSIGGGLGATPVGAGADEIVDEIEAADEDEAVDALLVKLNTPGGEIVPSEDIRHAAETFDGPTVAYATDVCASGGYDVASGCDEVWAREGSIVGSIGVIGSRVTVADLADRLGIDYEQLTAGEYKDAGVPLKELEEDERTYLQGIVDDYYEDFVSTVAEGRDLDPEAVRDTEARVFLGSEARERDLVDDLGTRADVESRLADLLDVDDVSVREFEPSPGLTARLQGGAESVAFALGAGVASIVAGDVDGVRFRH